MTKPPRLPFATIADTLAVGADVVLPTLAKGVIVRRPRMVAFVDRLGFDRRAVRRLQRLRARYGTGPLMLRVPGRARAVVLSPDHVWRVLEATPEPFDPATSEKHAALSHFEPEGVLISHGAARTERRAFNEAVLESKCPRHTLAGRFVTVVREEGQGMVQQAQGTLTWPTFTAAWHRIVRRVVLGDAAGNDHELTDWLAQLRSDANWAFLWPKRRPLRARFLRRLRRHLERAEPGSLASIMAHHAQTATTAAAGQVPQWLFAFDSAGIATSRALALLAAHPESARRGRIEIEKAHAARAPELPYLRACVLESLRLWPTTPLILRETTEPTSWDNGQLPARAGVLIFVPFFHRDSERLDAADRFAPELWLDSSRPDRWPLIPFSAGPAVCPGRQLVLLLASALLGTILAEAELRLLAPSRLDAQQPMPATLDNFALRVELTHRERR